MKRTRAPYGFWRELAFTLALMALMFRAFIPVGFMPDAHPGSGHLITICTGYGQTQMNLDADGKPAPHQSSSSEQPCGFAFNTALTGVPLFTLTLAPILVAAVFSFFYNTIFSHTEKFNHPSHAPPAA